MKRLLGTGVAALTLILAVLLATTTDAAAPAFVEGSGTVPAAVLERAGFGVIGWNPNTATITRQAATTVSVLREVEPTRAQAFEDLPDDAPVYAVFATGTFDRPSPDGTLLQFDNMMLLLDSDGRTRSWMFWDSSVVRPDLSQPFAASLDA